MLRALSVGDSLHFARDDASVILGGDGTFMALGELPNWPSNGECGGEPQVSLGTWGLGVKFHIRSVGGLDMNSFRNLEIYSYYEPRLFTYVGDPDMGEMFILDLVEY